LDFTTFLVILSALIAGLVIGFIVNRRQSPAMIAARTLGHTASAQPNGSAMANLLMYLGDPTDVRTLLDRAARWLQLEMRVPLVVIYPFDSAIQELRNPLIVGKDVHLTGRYRLGSGVWGEVAEARQPKLLDGLSNDPRFNTTITGVDMAYLAPLVAENTLIGVIGLFALGLEAFTAERTALIDQYGGLVAIQAIVAQRFSDSRQAIARFDLFQSLAQQLVTQLDLQDLLQPIVNAAREMLDTDMSILLEVRPDDDKLHPIAWSGISDETAMILESRLREDLKGLVGWARLPARTHNLLTDQRTARATQAVVAGMASELAAPVMYADKLFGVLAVETSANRNFTDEELNLLQSLAAQAGVALRNAQLYTRLKNTNQQLETSLADLQAAQAEIARAHAAEIRSYETELNTAREIQVSLLPTEAPPVPKIQVAARNIPARHVSGDFYQYYLLPGGKLGVAIGDVSGKGIPAALLMAVTTTALRDEIVQSPSATAAMNELNLRLLDRMQSTSMNSALCMAVFDPETGNTEVVNAGMVQPYLYVGLTNHWDPIEVGGYPLGASKRTKYAARTMVLTPGAMILMVSDGVIECQNPDGEFFGFERFEQLLNEMPRNLSLEGTIEYILSAVSQFAQVAEFQDDVTIVVMKAV
jgi:sigma-B regulation protein RsbU (phosphoserine phosphatase)